MSGPLAAFIPFGYPDYPRAYLDRFTQESVGFLKELGINLVSTEPVIVYDDTERALKDIRTKDVDFVVAVVLSWIEAPNVIAVLKEFSHKPVLLWSHTMFKENGQWLTLGPMPGAGVLRETLEEMGFKFKFVWGMPGDEKIKKELETFSRAAYAVSRLAKSKIGLLGYASMGMYTATFDHVKVRAKIGPEIDQLDQYMLIRKIDEIDAEEIEDLMSKVKKEWEITGRVTDEDLQIAMKMYLALRKIVDEYGWDAVTVKCQYELSRCYRVAPCVPLSMLGDEVISSCEGDIPLVITQLMMHYLSGETVTYADIHTINTTEKSVLLGACGFAPFKMALGRPRVDKHTALYMGLLNSTVYKTGRVTLGRLASDEDGYKMHIATGESNIPEPFHEVGCSPYPSMNVTLDGDPYHFGQHFMSQHYAIVYGDIKDELLEICKLLDIRPVTS